MKVYIVGNPLVEEDSLPMRMLSLLHKEFPHVVFEDVDPNENFFPEEGSVIIDTIKGISDVTWFTDIHSFITTKSVSAHDFDLGFHLQLITKLHKLRTIKILGIPIGMSRDKALVTVSKALRVSLFPDRKDKRQKRSNRDNTHRHHAKPPLED